MERITFLIEDTLQLLTCLMNPEDRQEALTVERSSGFGRDNEGSSYSKKLSDSPVQARGRGDTRLTLKLMFDTELDQRDPEIDEKARPPVKDLTGPTVNPIPVPEKDVRDLTRPLWELTEYTANRNGNSSARTPFAAARAGGPRAPNSKSLPQVRVFWGTAWEIPAVVESVAERCERFSNTGRPQRSWLTMRLLRVSDEVLAADLSSRYKIQSLPTSEEFAALTPRASDQYEWAVHQVLGGGTTGDQLWQLANRYYGDPTLWRLIAVANNIADPLKLKAGQLLRIPPLSMLARLRQLRESRA